jgi:large subunit ribosomal protein L17
MHHHKLSGTKLSRERDQRKAVMKALATSLVLKEKITTTKPKAKAVQPYVERLVTKAKHGGLHNRRQIQTAISTEAAVVKLVEDLAKRFANRSGGYTSIKPAGWRRGDNSEMATISFTEKAADKGKPVTEAKRSSKSATTNTKETANAKA